MQDPCRSLVAFRPCLTAVLNEQNRSLSHPWCGTHWAIAKLTGTAPAGLQTAFEAYHAKDPTKPLMASECCSCMTMRGEDRAVHPSTGGPGILAEWNAPCLTSQSNGSNGLPYMVGTEVWTLFGACG